MPRRRRRSPAVAGALTTVAIFFSAGQQRIDLISAFQLGGGVAFRPAPPPLHRNDGASTHGSRMTSEQYYSRTALCYANAAGEQTSRGFGAARQPARAGSGSKHSRSKRGRRGGKKKNRQVQAQARRGKDDDMGALRNRYLWLQRATMTLLDTTTYPAGSLTRGKWHELSSMMVAWSKLLTDGTYSRLRSSFPPEHMPTSTTTPPLVIEGLLKRLIDETSAGNNDVRITSDLYNLAIDAWAAVAAASESSSPDDDDVDGGTTTTSRGTAVGAARRAQEILRYMQKTYESTGDPDVMPNSHSFLASLGAWTRAACSSASSSPVDRSEAARAAHDAVLWMEELSDSGKNDAADPGAVAYSLAMDAFAKSGERDAGSKAEDILRHMQNRGRAVPNTFCYNIVINAYTRQGRRGGAIDSAERILTEMERLYDATSDGTVRPDVVSYTSVISAWARANRRGYGAVRAESILTRMEAIADEAVEAGDRDDGGGDDERGGAVVRPNTITYNAVLKAWSRSYDDRAPARAEALVRRMEAQYQAGNLDVKPDRISFNTLVHTLAKAGVPAAAQRAEDILVQMETLAEAGHTEWGPNLFSYNSVIEGWAKLPRQPDYGAQRAYGVLRRLIARQTDVLRPDSFSYNSVIFALSRSSGGVPDAAVRAEEILEHMEQARAAGNDSVKPDVFGYSSAIHAWSRSGKQGAGYRAEQILDKMERMYEAGQKQLKPNTVTFNSVIDAWAKSGEGTLGARRAEGLLHRMEDMYVAGDETVKPSAHTYNSVLSAWARSGTKCAHWKAEDLVNRMWELYESGNSDVKPDECSFNTLINAVSKSQREGKAQKALRILRRMDKLYKAGYKYARPNEFTYTSVLNSCAFTFVGDDLAKRKALDTAIFTLGELQTSHYGNPNHVTYGMFLKACANLMATDDERWRIIVEPVFLQCCRDGCVSGLVLSQLRDAAPADLYNNLLGKIVIADGAVVKIQDLPAEWRCNVRETKQWKNRGNVQRHRGSSNSARRGAGQHQAKRIRAERRLSPLAIEESTGRNQLD